MRAVITAQRKVNLGEAVLNYFFNLFALRKEASGDARRLTAMALEQLFEGRFITRAGRGHQSVICRFFQWMHKCLVLDRRRQVGRSDQAFPAADFFQLMR